MAPSAAVDRERSARRIEQDIETLADHFSARFSAVHSLPRIGLSSSARMTLQTAEWPGNIRQLGHALEEGERPARREHVERKSAVARVQQLEERLREHRVADPGRTDHQDLHEGGGMREEG